MKRLLLLAALVPLVISCTGMQKNFRRDLGPVHSGTEEPTTGGRWSERGLLEEDMRGGRAPASNGEMTQTDYSYTAWAAPENHDSGYSQQYMEQAQAGPSFSNTPNLEPPTKRRYKGGDRATRGDFIDDEIDDGSLWASDGQTNYYFTKNKVRTVGDIVTVTVQPDLYRDAITEVVRTLSPVERQIELADAQEKIRRRFLGLDAGAAPPQGGAVAATASAAERAPAATTGGATKEKEVDEDLIPRATYADIDVTPQVELKAGDMVMAEIVQRYPNGNYKIRGTKRLRYRNEVRFLNVLAVVRGSDISEEGLIESGKLYEYRLEVVR